MGGSRRGTIDGTSDTAEGGGACVRRWRLTLEVRSSSTVLVLSLALKFFNCCCF